MPRDGAGIFCVVKTRTQAARRCRTSSLSDGRHVWHQVAELVAEWGADLVGEHGLSSVGAVIGATHPRAVGEAAGCSLARSCSYPAFGLDAGSLRALGGNSGSAWAAGDQVLRVGRPAVIDAELAASSAAAAVLPVPAVLGRVEVGDMSAVLLEMLPGRPGG